MNEKRFTLSVVNEEKGIWRIYDAQGLTMITLKGVEERLNQLHQENQSLKFELDECANNKLYSRRKLEEENEQLKHELDSLTGCYCADNKEFKDYWRIGYND